MITSFLLVVSSSDALTYIFYDFGDLFFFIVPPLLRGLLLEFYNIYEKNRLKMGMVSST